VLYKVQVSAKLFAAGGPALPTLTQRLRIGDDCFTTAVPCESTGGGSREVCKPPR
jgi:hypothetical protein